MWRIVAKPRDTQACRLGLQNVRPRAAMHGDRTFPQAARASRRNRPTIGSAERTRGHAHSQVVGRTLIVVAQDIHDHLGCDRSLGRRDGAGVGVLCLRQVAFVRIQFGTFCWAEQAEDAPHTAAAVESKDVLHHLCCGRVAGSLRVGCVPIGTEEVEETRQVVLRAPPAHLLREFRDTRAVEKVIRIAQVHLPDREGVANCCDIAGWHALSSPNCTGVLSARHHVEDPQLLRVGHRQGLRAVCKVWVIWFTTVGAVEALVNSDLAHGLHSATRGRASLQCDLREVFDSRTVVAIWPIRRGGPTHGLGRACALTDGQALLVLHSIVHVPICIRLRHLRNMPDGDCCLLPIDGCILRRQGTVHNARVAINPIVQRSHAACWPGFARHADPANVRCVRSTVIGMADNRIPRCAGIFPNRNNCTSEGPRYKRGCNSSKDCDSR
mmetsp:Transcript_58292/g.147817  ORF Transcript_58292/g.147817 Transcript_58292/m.147817 type:complete len:439 (+) Transcript_58292:581-1897(+)